MHFLASKLQGAANRLAPGQKVTLGDCEQRGWENVRPGFVLSTGRSGTLFLNRLLLLSPVAAAIHQPRPELIRASRRAYEEIAHRPEIFAETFKSAREELVAEAAERGQVFIETNNRITFFAPIIRHIFPRAVFIHLVRHPGDFVRSGIRREWYSGTHSHDLGRIVPREGEMRERWDGLSPIEKIGWLWNETNQFIERFRETIPAEACLFVKAEELFSNRATAREITRFLGLGDVEVSDRLLSRPANVQRRGRYPHYAEWPAEDKDRLQRIAPLMSRYGYGADAPGSS